MSRINANIPALVGLRSLTRSQNRLAVSLERLATGLRINRGADDPAGLIVSSNLRYEIGAVQQAVTNSQRAANVVATTEAALNEVAALLNDINGLIVQAANRGALSDEEIRANQLQIDSAIESIARIANTATFAGRKLLDGSLDYTVSGVQNAAIEALTVNGAALGNLAFVPVAVEVVQSARRGAIFYETSQIGPSITLQVAGPAGVASLSFVSGTAASAIAAAVNGVAATTGVSAALINPLNAASGISFSSRAFGSDAFVQVDPLPGGAGFVTRDAGGNTTQRSEGRNITAVVNGAAAVGRGRDVTLNSPGLSVNLTLTESFNTAGSTAFAITGGGALFQLGPAINPGQQVQLGVQSIAPSRLGRFGVGTLAQLRTGEPLSLEAGREEEAGAIVQEAIRQVAVLRGRLGAFEKNTLQTNVSQLQVTLENLTSSESTIRDVDFAAETSELTRNQILVQAGTAVLAVANQTPQSVLALLRP